MIEQYLQQIGLTDTETAIFLTLYRNQRLTPIELSKKTGIKRPTVYAAAAELVRKGLIEEQNKNGKQYVVLSADQLKYYIEKRKRELDKESNIADQAILELETIPRVMFAETPSVRMIDTQDIEEYLYKMSPIWVKNMRSTEQTTWWGFQDKTFVQDAKYRKWIDWYWKQARGTDLKLLTNNSDAETKLMDTGKYRNRHIRYSEILQFSATQWIIGDYVINFVEDKNHSHIVEIKDKALAENFRNLFKVLFEQVD